MSNGLNLLRWSKRHDCRWSQFCGKAGQDDVEKKFIDTHMTCIWQKVAEENRRKKLSDVYDRIAGKSVKDADGESADK